MRRFVSVSVIVGVMCLAGTAQAAPELSAAYAKPMWMQTAMMVRTELSSDDSDKPEAEQADEREAFSAPPVGERTSNRVPIAAQPASPQEMAYQRERYERGLSLHRAGIITTIVGGVAVLPLTVGFIGTAFGGNSTLGAVFGIGLVGAAGAYYTGGFLASLGAFNATRAMNSAFGTQISTGVSIGGMVASSAGILLTPIFLGGFAPIIGIICGVVQIQQVKRALGDLGVAEFRIAPTPNGFAMSMRF